MGILIDLDAERAKRGKLRGFTQTEHVVIKHDGYSINERAQRAAPSSMAGRQNAFDERSQRAADALHRATDCGDEMLRYAEKLRNIAAHGDYNE